MTTIKEAVVPHGRGTVRSEADRGSTVLFTLFTADFNKGQNRAALHHSVTQSREETLPYHL